MHKKKSRKPSPPRSSSKKKTKGTLSERLTQNLSQTLMQFLSGRRYQPLTKMELFERLHIPAQLQEGCSEILDDLLYSNILEQHEGRLRLKKEAPNVVSGLLRMHAKGFGFVIPHDPTQEDIFIPKHLTDSAVDGDTVDVVINTQSISEKGPEGEIVAVTHRAHEHIAGIITQVRADGSFAAHAPLLGTTKPLIVYPSKDTPLKIGDRVILRVEEWGSHKEPTKTLFSHLLGSIEDASSDIPAAIEEFDLPQKFPLKVVNQAKKYGKVPPAKDLEKRVDLSSLETFTIDPDTAKDFDDALSLTKDKKGHYHLGVHIADVAHYVKPDSFLDKEAYARANSTYLPGQCIPMLPEELSNELCSLQPKKNRLTVSVLMEFDKTGSLLHHNIVRAYIKSRKRFTYFEAKEVLDKKKKSPHSKTLKLMVELCKRLKEKRYERGSIDFSMTESVIVLNEKGEPQGLKQIPYDITHQLVEEFMLKANEVVAMELNKRGKDLIYRVHEEPQEENREEFFRFARTLGFKLPAHPTTIDLQRLFEEAKGSPHQHQLSIAFIRSMRLAQYSKENVGHFGLALEHYCHFTSPIRRYSDLIIERLLFNEEPPEMRLDHIARHCSDQERVSFKAEMQVKNLKKLRLLLHYFKEDPSRVYMANITKIKSFGLFFELQDLALEGFLHISELENDYFIYDENHLLLRGKQTGKLHRIADVIPVRPVQIDLVQMQTQWHLAEENKSKRREKRGR